MRHIKQQMRAPKLYDPGTGSRKLLFFNDFRNGEKFHANFSHYFSASKRILKKQIYNKIDVKIK